MPGLRRRDSEGPQGPPRADRLRRLLRFAWRWGLRPLLVLVALLLALVWGRKAVHAVRSASMAETERLTEDLNRLERLLLRQHPAPYRNADRQEVLAALERARAAIGRHEAGEISTERVLAHFFEAVASLRDPHTVVEGRYDTFGILRVSFAIFGREVRLIAAPEERDLGANVLAFDGMPAAEALARIRPLAGEVTDSGFLGSAPGILRSPGLLHHAGVSTDPAAVTLRVERGDGTTASLALPRVGREEYLDRPPVSYSFEDEGLPAYRSTRPDFYWYEPLADHGALYIRFASSVGFADERVGELARRALGAREELGLERVVVDLRGNPGGNPHAHAPLVVALAASPETRGPHRLRVLVDRGTNSAAIVAAADLERRAGAMLVGEEPGDRAWMTGDARPFTLRHSGMVVWLSSGLMRSGGGAGDRPRLVPERVVVPTFADWAAGRDPALAAALEPAAPSAPAAGEAEPHGALPSGRFALDRQRTLTLAREGDSYRATVTGLGSDRLVGGVDGSWAGGIQRGLRADPGGRLERRLPRGVWQVLPPRAAPAPLELALQGRVEEAGRAYRELTSDGADRAAVAKLGLSGEGVYRYLEGNGRQGRVLFELARELSPADPLIPLQHSLLRREAEERWIPPAVELSRALAACARRYARDELLNDLWLCL